MPVNLALLTGVAGFGRAEWGEEEEGGGGDREGNWEVGKGGGGEGKRGDLRGG